MKIAIIGTAGRDKSIPMSKELWHWMVEDVSSRIQQDDILISGGAAWADHLAVELFLSNKCRELILHLPAPFSLESGKFSGPHYNSASSACNFYHGKFSKIIGYNSLHQIAEVISRNQLITFEPPSYGFAGMFERNRKVATSCDSLIAYTFGRDDKPKDGGTKHTWDLCKVEKVHVPLPKMVTEPFFMV